MVIKKWQMLEITQEVTLDANQMLRVILEQEIIPLLQEVVNF